jgi:hypothetical protein
MDPQNSLLKQIEHLVTRVEGLQRAVTDLYVEVQHLRSGLPHRPADAGGPVPFAQPVASFALRAVDRRSSPRRQANQVQIGITSALDDSKPFIGWVLDYSVGGLGLFVDKKLAAGTYLRLRPVKAAEESAWKEAQVKNCQAYLDGWRLGCQLESGFSLDELKHFGLE